MQLNQQMAALAEKQTHEIAEVAKTLSETHSRVLAEALDKQAETMLTKLVELAQHPSGR